MEELAMTVAILGAAFLILHFTFLWDKEEHILLRLLGSFFFIAILLLVPKVTIDYSQVCDFAVNQTVLNATTNTTDYTYDYVCSSQKFQTPIIFDKVILRFMVVFSAYVFIYLCYVALLKNSIKFNEMMKKLRKKFGGKKE